MASATCIFVDGKCSCGATLPPGITLPYYRKCGNYQPPPPQLLGDKVEAFLTRHGITERTYRDLKVFMHLSDNCNCAGRKEALNKFHKGLVESVRHLKEGELKELASCIGVTFASIRKRLFSSQEG